MLESAGTRDDQMREESMNEEAVPLAHAPSLLRRIFVGQQGIRAGWSIGIFFILLALTTAGFFLPAKTILEMNGLPLRDDQPLQAIVAEGAVLLGLLAASFIMAWIERRPLISYGLDGNARLRLFFIGTLSGLLSLSLLVGVMHVCGVLAFDGQNLAGWPAMQYGLAWAVAFLLVGIYEEYLLRGYLQSTLGRGIGFWWSAVVLSLLFGCSHLGNKGESSVGIVAAALVGLVFCISLWYLKNLWWAIGFHAAWDWGESYFWGTADSGKIMQGHLFSVHPQGNILLSGGSTGPEGSLLVIPLLLITAFLMWIAWRKRQGSRTAAVDITEDSPGQ